MIRKMSDAVIEVELQHAWAEIECSMRHGLQPSRSQSDYVAGLMREQKRRAA